MNERFTVRAAKEKVAASADRSYGALLERGSLELGFYAPPGRDPQEPHDQDEIYIVQSGSGTFSLGDKSQPFEAGEALFVPAGQVHRFEHYTADFAAWVIFYGPRGGEAP
jgi:mannose-6-phosphate isomerase-like protein (cupin superfamily)